MDAASLPQDGRKLMLKLGTCSQTLLHYLNREFGHKMDLEEPSVDPLAGGIFQKGKQCGMLWGSSLAAGAEAYHQFSTRDEATGRTIQATQALVRSFVARNQTVDCRDITDCDWSSKLSLTKYMLAGRFMTCFNMARDWAPEAFLAAKGGLEVDRSGSFDGIRNCASEVALRMGATDEQGVMVSGFAGGMGLSGNGCGALATAIWLTTISWCSANGRKNAFKNFDAKEVLEAFLAETGDEMLCRNLTGKTFSSVEEHSEFVRGGGCDKLIGVLTQRSR